MSDETNPQTHAETDETSKFSHPDASAGHSLGEKFRGTLTHIQSFEPTLALDWFNRTLQKHGARAYGKLATVVLVAYFLADVAAIFVGKYIPEVQPTRPGRTEAFVQPKTLREYEESIISRNLFSSTGKIPGEDVPSAGAQDPGGPATKTTLPFNLVGTLILTDELKSIATIEDKSASIVYPVRKNDEIPTKARILHVEANRVTFLNLGTRQREYVEFPLDLQSTAPKITLGIAGGRGGQIDQVSATQFSVSRAEVDKALGADLNLVLTQARAVPNFENGVANGYKLFQIVPGSIYDKIGLKNEDIIVGVGNEPVNDPGKAFEMIGKFKESSHVELQIKRGGKVSTMTYDIR